MENNQNSEGLNFDNIEIPERVPILDWHKNDTCHHCGRKGHIRPNCPFLHNDKQTNSNMQNKTNQSQENKKVEEKEDKQESIADGHGCRQRDGWTDGQSDGWTDSLYVYSTQTKD